MHSSAMVEIDYDLRYCIFDENFRENNMVISKAVLSQQRSTTVAAEIEYLSRKEPGKCKSIGLIRNKYAGKFNSQKIEISVKCKK